MAPLLLLAFVLSAQDKPPETCTLSGTVVNSITGEPLNKVEVRLESISNSQRPREVTTTDSQGRFTMVNVGPGSYHLSGTRNGYLETAYGARRARSDGAILRLVAGQMLAGLKLKLIPFGVIAGTIRDSDGEPLGDVHVSLARIVYQDGKPRLDSYDGAETDDLGQYRLRDLPPGKYYVGARQPRKDYRIDRSPADRPREDMVPTVYPGSIDPALAAPIEVRAGVRLTGIDITLARERTYALSGRVTNAAGPASGVSIALRPHSRTGGFEGFDLHTETLSRQGDFEFRGVAPGAYDLIARNGDLMGQVLVQIGSVNVEGVRIALQAGAKVHVHVGVEGDAKPDLARTFAFLEGDPRHAVMLGLNGGPSMWGERDPTVTPDRYRMKMAGVPKDYYVKSIRAGEFDVLVDGLTVEPAGSHEVQVVLGGDGGKVDGAVTDADGNPSAGATVVLAPEARLRQRADLFLTAATDQYGHFEVASVPPGDYKVFAWDDVEAGIWFDPDFLREREKQGVAVTVHPHGMETVNVRSGSLEMK